jgi:hypothetical protein
VKVAGRVAELRHLGITFTAEVVEIPPELMKGVPPEWCYKWVEERLLPEVHVGHVVVDKPVTLRQYRGRELRIAGAGTVIIARTYLVPSGENMRLFCLTILGEGRRPHPKDVSSFFDSIRVR